MINNLTILFTFTLLVIGESYPNDQLNHPTKCKEETIIPESIIKFLTILRQIQRDIDQTKQSFNDIVRQNQYWVTRNRNGEEIIDEKCINVTKLERTRYANFVLEHENDFENCADQLIKEYENSVFTSNLQVIENEAMKCISVMRQTKFWPEYEKSKRHFTEICTSEE